MNRPYALYVNGLLMIRTMTLGKAQKLSKRWTGNPTVKIIKETI